MDAHAFEKGGIQLSKRTTNDRRVSNSVDEGMTGYSGFPGVAAVWFVGFVMVAALGKERFAFTTKRGNDSLAQMPRFRHKVIELPQDFIDGRRLERIHGDRRQAMQSVLRKSAKHLAEACS